MQPASNISATKEGEDEKEEQAEEMDEELEEAVGHLDLQEAGSPRVHEHACALITARVLNPKRAQSRRP